MFINIKSELAPHKKFNCNWLTIRSWELIDYTSERSPGTVPSSSDMGDFNAHNPLWESEKTSTKWRMLGKILYK